jgi:hypothetical protein
LTISSVFERAGADLLGRWIVILLDGAKQSSRSFEQFAAVAQGLPDVAVGCPKLIILVFWVARHYASAEDSALKRQRRGIQTR